MDLTTQIIGTKVTQSHAQYTPHKDFYLSKVERMLIIIAYQFFIYLVAKKPIINNSHKTLHNKRPYLNIHSKSFPKPKGKP